MFDAFELEQSPEHARRLTGATLAAAAVLAGGLAWLAVVGNAPVRTEAEKQVDVSFRPPPPPPEPARIENPPPPPPRTAKPAGAAALVAPVELPKTAAPEVAAEKAVAEIHVAVGGTGDGSSAVVAATAPDGDESAAPAVSAAGSSGPINLPEDADPPEPDESNPQPEYPESARATGQEARVTLKVIVEADGRVGRIQVLRGEEPFTSAALAAVRQWKYEPARLNGQPIAVYKIIDLKFRLRE